MEELISIKAETKMGRAEQEREQRREKGASQGRRERRGEKAQIEQITLNNILILLSFIGRKDRSIEPKKRLEIIIGNGFFGIFTRNISERKSNNRPRKISQKEGFAGL